MSNKINNHLLQLSYFEIIPFIHLFRDDNVDLSLFLKFTQKVSVKKLKSNLKFLYVDQKSLTDFEPLSISYLFQVPRGLYVNILLVSPDGLIHTILWYHIIPDPHRMWPLEPENSKPTCWYAKDPTPLGETCWMQVWNWFSKLWIRGTR